MGRLQALVIIQARRIIQKLNVFPVKIPDGKRVEAQPNSFTGRNGRGKSGGCSGLQEGTTKHEPGCQFITAPSSLVTRSGNTIISSEIISAPQESTQRASRSLRPVGPPVARDRLLAACGRAGHR